MKKESKLISETEESTFSKYQNRGLCIKKREKIVTFIYTFNC